MTYFKHLLPLLLIMVCMQMTAMTSPNGDADSPVITFTSGNTTLSNGQEVPNGTLIQLKASNFPEDAVFRYLIGEKAATEADFKTTKSKDNKDGLTGNAPLVYQHGIPVFASYTTTESPVVLSVQVVKPTKKAKGEITSYSPYYGYTNIYTLTLNIDNNTTAVTPPPYFAND